MTFSSVSNLATWKDKSISQYTASNFGVPVYTPNIQNTRGVIQFATGGGITVPSFSLSPQMSVFMVYYPNGQGTNGPPIEQSSNSSLYPGFLVESGISNFLIRTNIPAPSGLTFSVSGTTVVGAWSAYTGAVSYSYTVYSNSIYSYIGGTAVSGASATLTAPTATFTYSSPVSGTYYYTLSVTTSAGTSLLATSAIIQFSTVSATTSGGTIVTSGSNKYHIFTTNSNFVLTSPSSLSINTLIIGGGGGGGSSHGGGGGAGELIYTSASITNTTYAIVVGTGGPIATNGVASSAFSISANYGGKGGGSTSGSNASTGGSGGGGCGYSTITSGAASVKTGGGLGNAGGSGLADPGGGGGGGGAGAAGSNSSGLVGGVGGNGTNSYSSLLSIISSSMPSDWQTATSGGYIAGGGGGGCWQQAQGIYSVGGLGGAGSGGNSNNGVTAPTAAINYTGSGGGGGGSGGQAGAAGGTGLVVVVVPTSVTSSAPTSLTFSITSGTASMAWTAASGATSNYWTLYRSTSNGYYGTSNASGTTTGSATAPVTAPTGLTSGAYWYFTVAASNASTLSPVAVSSIVSY